MTGLEIDFLPIGEESKSGDAVTIRMGNLNGRRDEYVIIVVDGGYQSDGEKVVDHINNYYNPHGRVDLVLSTHGDQDHIGGLPTVMSSFDVGQLWMHLPWKHSQEIGSMFSNGRLIEKNLSSHVKALLENAKGLEDIARQKGVPIFEPFSDTSDCNSYEGLRILGPSTTYYEELLPSFREFKETAPASVMGSLIEASGHMMTKALEAVHIETLKDPADDATTAENNSSAILLITFQGEDILLTADAGVPALTQAVGVAEMFSHDLKYASLQQIPHHGSKRNMGPTLLDRMVGLRGSAPAKTIVVSAAKKGEPKHPSAKVTNAYKRRSGKVFTTQGKPFSFRLGNTPSRGGYGPATEYPWKPEGDE